jgi:autotransporter translocation and assembly factor TamB
VLDELILKLGQAPFRASGTLTLDAVDFEAQLSDLPLKAFEIFGVPPFSGSAGFNVRVTGNPRQPQVTLDLTAKDIGLRDQALPNLPPLSLSLKASSGEGVLNADLSISGAGKEPITAVMKVPLQASLIPAAFSFPENGLVEGKASAKLQLKGLPGYLQMEDQTLGGTLFLTCLLSGSVKNPRINGEMRVKEGAYENTPLGLILDGMEVNLRLEGERLLLDRAVARAGREGGISGKGWLDLIPEKDYPFQVDLSLSKARLLQRDDLAAVADGEVRLSGTMKGAVLSGDATIDQAELRIPDRLSQGIVDIEVTEINKPAAGKKIKSKTGPPLSERIDLDLNLGIPGRVFLRGRGLDSEWEGRLKITGQASNPEVKGTLNVVRGRFDFLEKRFNLTEGNLRIDSSALSSSDVALTAAHWQKDMMAYIQLSGPVTAPKLTLRSEPSFPSDEILARILFGRSASNITPFQALRLAHALNALSGGVSAFDLMDKARRQIGVDSLDLKSSEGTEGGTAVSVGKYLSNDVYLEVEQGTGSRSGKVSMEVELTPHISLESEVGTDAQGDAQGGAGINWKWDY